MATPPLTILHAPAAKTPFHPFPSATDLEAHLRRTVRGEVRFDQGTRALYATDASNYRQIPIGLVVPLDAADIEATLAACREFEAPVLARGAATSLAGQGCNTAVILDFSKYMRRVLSVDPEGRTARVEPGVVLDRVREAAEKHALTFAPDPATHSRCTLGGMIGNNSCGTHSLLGGKTVDNVESLDILLYDGTRMTVGPTTEEELEAIIATGGRQGEIYAGLKKIRDQYASLIRERFPRIPRRVSGYNLDELLPEQGFNVARALVGSEGTCVTILEAKLRLVKSPQFRRLVGLGFSDAFIAADNVPLVLEHHPIALEGFDGLLVEFMQRKNLATEEVRLLPEGKGYLLVELGADSAEEADAKAEAVVVAAQQFPARPSVRSYTPEEARKVWFVRESALGATAFVPGEPVGWEGWEDAAVAPHKLGEYLRAIFALMQEYGYRSPMYGHFGHGCVHLRINFDFQSERGIAIYREFVDRATDLVVSLGGSISGEHGDGQARGALLEKMFGPELMEAFREFKRLWDPLGRMNPGKLIDAYQPHDYLRLNTSHPPMQTSTHFHFPADGGSFEQAALRCVGVGACRKADAGTMCPSYMATKEEKHSTRGRAHLLWEMMQGDIIRDGWRSEEVREALDLCLACKACKTECPVNVDMATYKAEFLAHHYEGRLRPLGAYAFGFIDKWSRLASIAPGIANGMASWPLTSKLAKAALHIHPNRTLPSFSSQTFRKRSKRLKQPEQPKGDVLLWADTFNNYLHSDTAVAAHKVLTDAGFRVHVLQQHVCCGRPLYDFGLLDSAKKYLHKTLDALTPYAEMPVVVLEPSCATVFRDELVNLLPSDARAAKLRDRTYLLSQFLVKHAPEYKPPVIDGTILVQGHCHHQAVMKMTDEMQLLRSTGADVRLLDSGCCGMAGPFGFEKDKYEVSQTLAERVLLPAVRAAKPGTLVVADGFSCREQVAQNSETRALHLAEVLARDL
ncbi:FAD-binding and (Fe-S)-binding domain-containing protein [Granulicella sp. S156]|uniref:FAD-binding and (Fe-S)-binding domain-containing protein n=1 Tax=Granulicella sp. S156 TaxID=1747224 RepID=UPI00131B20E7|nr:FAD-binding and (Fe-S)-binding domain-containing protein [Granulicella sp. S156]